MHNATIKRNTTVTQLHEFDATQTAVLTPIEQDLATMATWIADMERLFTDGVTDIRFSSNQWANLYSQNTLKTDLVQRTAAIAGLPVMMGVNGQPPTMFGALLAGQNLIRFGYGFVDGPNPLYELGILTFPGMATYGKPIAEVNGEFIPNEEQVNVFVSEGEELSPEEVAQLINYLKNTDFDDPNRKSGTQPLPPYDEEITFEGMRKVVGGNGPGTPDGLAPYAMGAFDFSTEDIGTMFGANATVNERLEAAAFTFIKPAKAIDTAHDAWKAGQKAKDAGKGIDKTRPSWRQSEIDVEKDFSEYNAQKSFKDGIEVPYGEKGSSRPDLYQTGHSIEVKNYKITTSSGRSSLVNNVSKQVEKRLSDLPSDTKQSVIIDIRGQNVSDEILDELYEKIMNKTNSKVDIRFKTN
ncbi:T7SS effector LXG polymorphic toxin [Sporosarcina sp. NPDC096371]|uniref:T7SS effector LXG polymorphic toxin n=1 Tax=Sporosarcina sp. NPDC096371 TaxID=3364530 RepID=UPI00380A835C